MHRTLLNTFIIDAPAESYDRTASFWAEALGAEMVRPTKMPEYRILEGASADVRVVVQDVHLAPPGIHFDIHTDNLEAEVDRLQELGATVVDDSFITHPGQWVIMADPAGRKFCVVYALNPLRPQADRDAFERKAKVIN